MLRFALVMLLLSIGCAHRAAQPEPTWVRLDHHGCFGACPEYDVVVFADGRVRWHGQRFVADGGERWDRVSPARARALLRRAARFEFGEGRLCKTDERRTTTMLRRGAETLRHVHDYGWCRDATTLEARALDRRIARVAEARSHVVPTARCRAAVGSQPFLRLPPRVLDKLVDVPDGATTLPIESLPEIARISMQAFLAHLRAHPELRLELWTFAPARTVGEQRLDAVVDMIVTAGIDKLRIDSVEVGMLAVELGDRPDARTVHVRAAPPACVAPAR